MQTATELEKAFNDHYAEVVAFCRRRVSDHDVDEVVGDVFAELWRKARTVDPTRVRAWLFGVARHKIANHHRAHRRRTAAELRLVSEGVPPTPRDPAISVVERSVIIQAAERLSDADRELLELISWEGLTPAELSVVLGCTIGTVNVRIHRMRERLHVHLAEIEQPRPSERTSP